MLCLEHFVLRYAEINYILNCSIGKALYRTAILIPMYYTK